MQGRCEVGPVSVPNPWTQVQWSVWRWVAGSRYTGRLAPILPVVSRVEAGTLARPTRLQITGEDTMPEHRRSSTQPPPTTEAPTPVEMWTLPRVAKALKLSRTKLYELIWREHLPIHKFGRAVRVSPGELQRWLEKRVLGG